MSLVEQFGPHNWVRISSLLVTRSPKQCRERFHQNLKPTLNHGPISDEEGLLIEQLVNEKGKKWADIARCLPGRSDNAIKNWWNGGMNRRRRRMIRNRDVPIPAGPGLASTAHSSGSAVNPYCGNARMRLPPLDSAHANAGHGYAAIPVPTHGGHHHLPSPASHHAHSSHPHHYHHPYYRPGVHTPLPSPSQASVMSLDGGAPPSLMSDVSVSPAMSRSPGASSIISPRSSHEYGHSAHYSSTTTPTSAVRVMNVDHDRYTSSTYPRSHAYGGYHHNYQSQHQHENALPPSSCLIRPTQLPTPAPESDRPLLPPPSSMPGFRIPVAGSASASASTSDYSRPLSPFNMSPSDSESDTASTSSFPTSPTSPLAHRTQDTRLKLSTLLS